MAGQVSPTTIKLKLNRAQLASIVEEVIEPFYRHMRDDSRVKHYIQDEQLLYRLKIKQTVFLLSFLQQDFSTLRESLKNSSNIHRGLGIQMHHFIYYFLFMTQLLIRWILIHAKGEEARLVHWKGKMVRIFGYSMIHYADSGEKEHMQLFLQNIEMLFDHSVPDPGKLSPAHLIGEEKHLPEPFSMEMHHQLSPCEDVPEREGAPESRVDMSMMQQMHYTDDQKINAVSFLEEVEPDWEAMDELDELRKDSEEVLYLHDELQDGLIKQSYVLFFQYARVLNALFEFKDLGYALTTLVDVLKELKAEGLSEKQKKQVLLFIRSIIEDLDNWKHVIFIEQSAKDIHFLDASLFSSIAQLEMIIQQDGESSSSEDDDNDLELF